MSRCSGGRRTFMLFDKRRNPVVERLRRIAMRRMSAAIELRQLRLRDAFSDRIDLRHRAVMVVMTLHGEQRTANGTELIDDAPRSELRAQPHIVPAIKSRIDIVVIARELAAQIRLLVRSL